MRDFRFEVSDPVIGMVGLIENTKVTTTMEFKEKDDFIVACSLNELLAIQNTLKLFITVEGPIANIDMRLEHRVQSMCLESIEKGIINLPSDLSDGGLAVNIAESIVCSKNNLGASLDLARKTRRRRIIRECPSVIIVSQNELIYMIFQRFSKKHDIHTQTIGKVTDDGMLNINDKILPTETNYQNHI